MSIVVEGGNMFEDDKFHVIPSIRSMRYLDKALESQEEWILLSGCVHIGNLRSLVMKCHKAGKKVIVNHETVGGLGADRAAFQLLEKMYEVDCVMGSSGRRIGMAQKTKMKTIQRISLTDSMGLDSGLQSIKEAKADIIELRPAYYAMSFLHKFKEVKDGTYIAGGFIDSKEMLGLLHQAGFNGATVSDENLWDYSIK